MAPTTSAPLNENGIPPFDSLPLRKDNPPYSAWGLYGDSDELGTLNRLTDERVAAAARDEIKTGTRVSLNWPLDAQSKGAFFARKVFHQELIRIDPHVVNDDVWSFNSQSSSQWDGLRHFAYQKERRFYNGVTMEQIHGVGAEGEKSTVNGIQAWQEKGIVGRGILVDYHSWRLAQEASSEATSQQPHYDPFSRHAITLADIQACLAAQGTVPRFGDILFTRTGFTAAHASKTPAELDALRRKFMGGHGHDTGQGQGQGQALVHTFGGLERGEHVLRWIWDNFSAVAGDQPSFECWPPGPGPQTHTQAQAQAQAQQPSPAMNDYAMHEVLLSGWGCPIGELFDLEALAENCKREGRWSFFVSSEVCNVPGGVARCVSTA